MSACRRAGLALLGVAVLKGCIVVPYYSHTIPTRMNVEKALADAPGFPRPGVATREDVALRLGQPDVADEQAWTYEWSKVVVVIPGCNSALEITQTSRLRIGFDARGIVRDVTAK